MTFDILDYLGGLTGFVFDKSVLQRIALECGVSEVTEYADLTEEDRDKCLIKLYETILDSPNELASASNQHGAYTMSIGTQVITDKVREDIRRRLHRLLKKWDLEDEYEDSNLSWIDENEYPCTVR